MQLPVSGRQLLPQQRHVTRPAFNVQKAPTHPSPVIPLRLSTKPLPALMRAHAQAPQHADIPDIQLGRIQLTEWRSTQRLACADAGPSADFPACRHTRHPAGARLADRAKVHVQTGLVHAHEAEPHLCSRLRHCSLSRARRLSAFSSCSSSSATEALCTASMPAISLSRSCTWQACVRKTQSHSRCRPAGTVIGPGIHCQRGMHGSHAGELPLWHLHKLRHQGTMLLHRPSSAAFSFSPSLHCEDAEEQHIHGRTGGQCKGAATAPAKGELTSRFH